MNIIVKNGLSNPSSNPVCISHHASTLGKSKNPTILPPVMGKIVDQTRLSSLGMATDLAEGKLWFQTRETPYKNWLCVAYSSYGGTVRRVSLHSSKLLPYWNFTIRLFTVISRRHVVGVVPICKEAVGVFYSPSRLGKLRIRKTSDLIFHR